MPRVQVTVLNCDIKLPLGTSLNDNSIREQDQPTLPHTTGCMEPLTTISEYIISLLVCGLSFILQPQIMKYISRNEKIFARVSHTFRMASTMYMATKM